jgi:hypothetical protein
VYLEEIKTKAGLESVKVKEVAFITSMTDSMKVRC